MIADIDADIEKARVIARGGQPPPTVDMAITELAEMKIKLEKAEAHAQTAMEHVSTAQHEVEVAERTLRSLLEPKSSPSDLALQAFQKLAETLTALQSTAKSAENGSVQVDPLILNQLAAFVQQGAKTVSPAKRRRKAPPWAPVSDTTLESVA